MLWKWYSIYWSIMTLPCQRYCDNISILVFRVKGEAGWTRWCEQKSVHCSCPESNSGRLAFPKQLARHHGPRHLTASVVNTWSLHMHGHGSRPTGYLISYPISQEITAYWIYLCLRLFNVLPPSAENVTNTHGKKVILKWLVNKTLYSVEDYFKITA